MKKRILALLLATTLVASMLVGCGGKTDTDSSSKEGGKTKDSAEVQELQFWGWWSSEARKPHILAMVEGFNESQDQYHVTYVDIPFGDIFTKNTAQIAAGKPCDIMANSMEEVKFRASEGQVEPIDEYLTDDVKAVFYEQYMDACTGDDGAIYALPYSVDTRVIYYNKAHFEEAGINADEIISWDDLEAAARKLDKKNGDQWERIGFVPLLGNGDVDTWVINANNGETWFDPETLDIQVDTDTNRDVMKWIRTWIEFYGQNEFDALQAAFDSGMSDPFASGKMSMLVHTSAYTSNLTQNAPDMEYGVIQFPEYKSGTGHQVNGGGFVLEIPKGAKCPEGSYEFMKYVSSKETQEFLATKIGDFSARNDFDDSSDFFKNPINQQLAKCLEETSTVIVPNKLKGYQDILKPLIQEGTLGIVETDKALANAQKEFEDYVGNAQ